MKVLCARPSFVGTAIGHQLVSQGHVRPQLLPWRRSTDNFRPAGFIRPLKERSVRICAAPGATQDATTQGAKTTCQIKVEELTPEGFRPFGQVCGPQDDGKGYDEEDAQLVLDRGTPRFYIMELPRRGLIFDRITYHADVTQCLGAVGLYPWYMAVAAPSGSVEAYPRIEDLRAFRVLPGQFIKLHQGTWHAGPLFDDAGSMAFYNLELADTNVVDHNTHDYAQDGLLFELAL